ncbi:MAG: hypothetical protein AB7I19_16925 [Planctomycetota bacterium]
MKHFHRLAIAALAAGTIGTVSPAQIVSPAPFYATHEGDGSIPYGFTQPSRMQQIHGDRIGSPNVITGLSFRRDGISNGSPHAAVQPKSVTLDVVFADSVASGSATNDFVGNRTGNTVTVFQGQISTPPTWAIPATTAPADFDFRLPLTPWVYQGTAAFLWEVTATATSANTRINVDSAQSAFPLFSWCSYSMVGTGCNTPTGTFDLRGRGQNLGGLGSFTVAVTATGAPANTTCAWITGVTPANLPITGLCTALWPSHAVSVSASSDATGRAEPFFQVPSNPAWLDVPLEMQMFAPDPSQSSAIPIAGSNGITYRVAPMAPSFAAGLLVAVTPNAATGTLLANRAAIVRFD